MTHTRIRSFLLALFLVILTLSLTACYTITLKEKRIDGMGSSITVKLPGNPQKLDFPVPVDPLTQRYFKGSRLYGEIDSGLYVAIYTNSIDTQQMYDDLHISQGQAISQRLNQTAEAAAGAVLSKIDAKNVSVSQDTTTVSGQHAVVQAGADGEAAFGEGCLGTAVYNLEEELAHSHVDSIADQICIEGFKKRFARKDFRSHSSRMSHAGTADGFNEGFFNDAVFDIECQFAGTLLRSTPAYAMGQAADIFDFLYLYPFAFFRNRGRSVICAFRDGTHILNFC